MSSLSVNVYVEGPSDKYAMETLLSPLIQQKKQQGIAVEFFESPSGDKKKTSLTKVPVKAANTLLNRLDTYVVAVPDLYPMNRGFPHTNAGELIAGMKAEFQKALERKAPDCDPRIAERFRAFCFKHDLEALLLASEEALRSHLGVSQFKQEWRQDVEEQDDKNPPKRIVERLFQECGKKYHDVVDAPLILSKVRYEEVAARCPQGFGPFVDFLQSL
ncbi:MAG TPA: DUF4276 family protein [bacterium]|nr:DUF4276 family protein [bacterium]HPO08619.1 DUF4276 family protein [bacterium]HQO35652.1 DUF4276 family protein [bacterium]HQP97381.1 DUF4276 family protein [bacterium]